MFAVVCCSFAKLDIPVLVVGNKADLADASGNYDARAAATAYAQEHNMHTLTTSAKTGAGVSEAFIGLARMLMSSGTGMPGGPGAKTTVGDLSTAPVATTTCCTIS